MIQTNKQVSVTHIRYVITKWYFLMNLNKASSYQSGLNLKITFHDKRSWLWNDAGLDTESDGVTIERSRYYN